MATRSDSWGSVAEVEAMTGFALRGAASFNASSTPTVTQVEKFIDRASGVLNVCLLANGFTPATIAANSTATLVCDDWVVDKASHMVQLAQPGASFDETDLRGNLGGLHKEACEFVAGMAGGFKEAGVGVGRASSEGLAFTGIDKHDERSDPDNDTREQPLFRRRRFDNKKATGA